MRLDFTEMLFRNQALSIRNVNYERGLSAASAFILLLIDVDYETIDNLCEEVGKRVNLSPLIVYKCIQQRNLSEKDTVTILDCAYDIVDFGGTIGSKMNGRFNTSSWISHSLFEGRCASVLANSMGLDPDTAMKTGLLHDVGRKFDHSFMHTVKGYEYLCKLGYPEDAVCCLTHSFLSNSNDNRMQGNRCANCDPALIGFVIDDAGNGVFLDESQKDDLTLFLENYNYSLYDLILNIADLMATSKDIVSPYDRMQDVYTRKFPDPQNSPFFKVCFINSMRRILFMLTKDGNYIRQYNIKEFNSIEEIEELLVKISDEFMQKYNELVPASKLTLA